MKNFYVTFGQKYRDQVHPKLAEIHPDSYIRIEAEDETQARQIAWTHLEEFWGFLYAEDDFNFGYYPKGELTVLRPSVD